MSARGARADRRSVHPDGDGDGRHRVPIQGPARDGHCAVADADQVDVTQRVVGDPDGAAQRCGSRAGADVGERQAERVVASLGRHRQHCAEAVQRAVDRVETADVYPGPSCLETWDGCAVQRAGHGRGASRVGLDRPAARDQTARRLEQGVEAPERGVPHEGGRAAQRGVGAGADVGRHGAQGVAARGHLGQVEGDGVATVVSVHRVSHADVRPGGSGRNGRERNAIDGKRDPDDSSAVGVEDPTGGEQ